MIDGKKLYKWIKAQINPYGKPFEGTAYEFGLKVMDYIKAMEKQPQADWIPCEERLPDVEKKVLVTLWCHRTEQGFLSRKGKWFVIADDGINEATVLAWQPLPQPYKKEGAE